MGGRAIVGGDRCCMALCGCIRGSAGMIDPKKCLLYAAPELRKFKLDLFTRVGRQMAGMTRDHRDLAKLPADITPIVGCTPVLRQYVVEWQRTGRQFIYWDRGYARRVFATWLPRGANGGYYRWHINAHQMQRIRNVPGDRWKALQIDVAPWRKRGRKIVIASTLSDYWHLHGCVNWVEETAAYLRTITDRPVIIRDKESKLPLDQELADAHCLVAHGSIAAIESVIMGCPVFVHPSCAAALVGKTDFADIENPIYPERRPWLNSLAYCQFNEAELVDGTLWRLME